MSNTVHTAKQIRTDHQDLIQDIAFDYFGKRVATASLDQMVKIWNVGDNNEWQFKEELKINPGLFKIAWAHPEFGQLIAVAHDRYVWFYEETSCATGRSGQSGLGWSKKLPALSDARANVTDIKFAPKNMGLQLVVCAANGEARIYECSDIFSSNWAIAKVFNVSQQEIRTNMGSCNTCSWSTCFSLPVLLAFGSDEPTSQQSKLSIYEYSDNTKHYQKIDMPQSMCQDPIRCLAFAPSVGKLYHTLAVASKSLIVVNIVVSNLKQVLNKEIQDYKYTITSTVLDSDISAWRVCWNTIGSVLACAGDDRRVRLWKCNYMGTWKCFAEIAGDTCSTHMEHNFFYDNEYISREKSNDRLNQQQSIISSSGASYHTVIGGTSHQDNFANSIHYQNQTSTNNNSSGEQASNTRFFQSGPLSQSANQVPWH